MGALCIRARTGAAHRLEARSENAVAYNERYTEETMKASNPKEIGDILRDDKSGLRETVVRNLGDFTVALLAIYNGSSERLALAGVGTLVVIDKAHFILTARHVWDEVLSKAEQIGLTLKPEIDHKYGVARKEFAVFGLPKPAEWNEWGPDLILLHIPPNRSAQSGRRNPTGTCSAG